MQFRRRYQAGRKSKKKSARALSWWESQAQWEDTGSDSDGETSSWLSKWDGSEFRKTRHRVSPDTITDMGKVAAAAVYAANHRRNKGLHIEAIDSYIVGVVKTHYGQMRVVAYDRALRAYAEHYGAAVGLKGKALDRHADGFAANAALDLLPMEHWLAMARHYLPEPPPQEGGQNGQGLDFNTHEAQRLMEETGGFGNDKSDRRNSNKEILDGCDDDDDGERADDTVRAKARAAGEGYADWIRPVKHVDLSGLRPSAQYLATALEDCRRQTLTSDWSGSHLGNDAAIWACGGNCSPLAEADQSFGGLCDVLILVDASSSTNDTEQTNQILAAVAHDFMVALRGAGHGAAMIPWSYARTGLNSRGGRVLWGDSLPSSAWPVYGHGGTVLECATKASRMAFYGRRGRRKIALILTDGAVNGAPKMESDRPARWNFGADLAVLWSIGPLSECPKDWNGPMLQSKQSATMMDDLLGSDIVRYLSGLSR